MLAAIRGVELMPSGDPALAAVYAEAMRRYAADCTAMADAAVLATFSDHAGASLRASGTWQTEVEPARRAWQSTYVPEYTPVHTEEEG